MSPARVRTQQQYPIQACQRANSITPTLRGQSFRTPNRIDQSNDSGLDSLGWFLLEFSRKIFFQFFWSSKDLPGCEKRLTQFIRNLKGQLQIPTGRTLAPV